MRQYRVFTKRFVKSPCLNTSKELEKFRMYDHDQNDIVSWQEILEHHREVLKNPKKPFQKRINQLIEKCDTNKNIALDWSELSNL